jgi:hypothetical protein
MKSHGIEDRSGFLAHAMAFDSDDNGYLKKAELENAAKAWNPEEVAEEEAVEEVAEEAAPEEEAVEEVAEEAAPEEVAEEAAPEEEAVEEVAEAEPAEEGAKSCAICSTDNEADAATCTACGFTF